MGKKIGLLIMMILLVQTLVFASDLRLIGMGYMHQIVSDDIDYQFNVANLANNSKIKLVSQLDYSNSNRNYSDNNDSYDYDSNDKSSNFASENVLIMPVFSVVTLGLEYDPAFSQSNDFYRSYTENSGENSNEDETKYESSKLGILMGCQIIPQINLGIGYRNYNSIEKYSENATFNDPSGLTTTQSSSLADSTSQYQEYLIGASVKLGTTLIGLQAKTKDQNSVDNNTYYADDEISEVDLQLQQEIGNNLDLKACAAWIENKTPYSETGQDYENFYTESSSVQKYLLGAEQNLGSGNILAYAIGLEHNNFMGSNEENLSEDSGSYDNYSMRLGTEFKLWNLENLYARFGILQQYYDQKGRTVYKDPNGDIANEYSYPSQSWSTTYTTGLGYKMNQHMAFDIVFTSGLSPVLSDGYSYESNSGYPEWDGTVSQYRYKNQSSDFGLLFGLTAEI